MRELDVVYILKNSWKSRPEELRYSLRSVERFFPCRMVWFFGGFPPGFEPDRAVTFMQEGADRFERVRMTIRRAVETPEVSEDFWLFNDDFFVLDEIREEFAFDRGEIRKHALDLYKRHGFHGPYERMLVTTAEQLEEAGYPTKDYTLHLPLMVNKTVAREALDTFPAVKSFRCLYGNFSRLESITINDVKTSDITGRPSEDGVPFFSTSDGAFKSGAAGSAITRKFPTPSRWEVVK